METATDGVVSFVRLGTFDLPEMGQLAVWKLQGYGGGIFVPFRDATAGQPGGSFGAGRYLIDTIKGAFHGVHGPVPAPSSCLTSTSPTTPPAHTTRPGPARCPVLPTVSPSRSLPANCTDRHRTGRCREAGGRRSQQECLAAPRRLARVRPCPPRLPGDDISLWPTVPRLQPDAGPPWTVVDTPFPGSRANAAQPCPAAGWDAGRHCAPERSFGFLAPSSPGQRPGHGPQHGRGRP